jgi:hypothetical protein
MQWPAPQFHDMSDFNSYEPVPTLRFAMYGVLTAAGLAALGYFQHAHYLYTAAVFSGALFGGGGFLLNWLRSHAEPGQPALMRIPVSIQTKAVKLIQILALPTALMGYFLFQDIFLAPPQQDVARITCKYDTRGTHSTTDYWIEARGQVLYRKSVARSFWRQCNAGDEIKLAITPRFKEWRHVSLMRNGKLVAESIGFGDFFGVGVYVACLFVPCIFFLPSVSKTVPDPCSRQDIKSGVFCVCLLIETVALYVWADMLFKTFGGQS